MQCPSDIAEILLDILGRGLIRIRLLGWAGDPARCALEADHIHNLPSLLADYSPQRLAYYWEAERPSYMNQTPTDDLQSWEPLWSQLRPYAEAACAASAPRS